MGDVRIREWGVPGDLGWVVMAHGELYAAELGWGSAFEHHVARVVAEIGVPAGRDRQRAWIADLDGRRIGCVACTPSAAADDVAQLRILLLHPDARGLGVGARLVDACIEFATAAGYRRLALWTTDAQVTARALYEKRGFRVVSRSPHSEFGTEQVGLDYELDLASSTG